MICISLLVRGQNTQGSFNQVCTNQNLPVTVGGSRDDVAQCTVYDPINQLIIVGGTTQSSDFGPANSNSGFLYAINLQGDWTWGHYFQNFTSSVEEITGCELSSDGKQIVALGTTREQVVMAVVDGASGRISNMYSLENRTIKRSDNTPIYLSYGAIMLDVKDPVDSKPYIYASFLMDNQQQLVKILQAIPDRTNEFPSIKYHYNMFDIPESENEDDFVRQKIPQHMFSVPQDSDDSFYVSGTYRGVGSVMKFYKKNAALRWHAQLNSMTRVDAIAVQPNSNSGHFFGCGSNNFDDRGLSIGERSSHSEAWFFSMKSDGEVKWQLSLQGTDSNKLLTDSCRGIVFDQSQDTLVTVIETDSPQFKVNPRTDQRDTLLLEINLNGGIEKAIAFTLGSNQYNMFSFSNNLVHANNYYYMSGGLNGFQTRTQFDMYASEREKDLDTFLFPLAFENRPTERCLNERQMSGSDLSPFSQFYNRRESYNIYELRKGSDREVPKTKQGDSVFRLYYSKFVQSRPLKSFIRTPRPCAFQSLQLAENPVQYYRGSEAITYRIADESPYAPLITQMAPDQGGYTIVIDQKGNVTDLAQFSPDEGGKIDFYSNVVRQIGLNELTIRHCDYYERLFDLRLQIDVKYNTQPVFVDTPQTNFFLAFNDTQLYRLPDTIDPQGNANAEILVEPFDGYENLYPPFMTNFNGNRTFEFVVDKEEYAGKSYFYKVILKEVGVNAIGFSYYCQIIIDSIDGNGGGGSPILVDETGGNGGSNGEVVPVQDGNRAIASGVARRGNVLSKDNYETQQENKFLFVETYTTDLVGRTQIKFTQPIDMAKVEADFDKLFPEIYVQKADYQYSPQNITLQKLSLSNFNNGNQTVDVTFEFKEPFELGLNIGKSDFVFFFLNETYPWKQILSPDVVIPEGKTLQTKVRARIELTFDFNNSQMETVVFFSTIFAIVLITLVVLQLVLLIYKNVGLLTFWILIDYAQLVAFLPLTTVRCVPFVYEAFRPFLASHLIFTWPGQQNMMNQVHSDYFNLSFQAFDIDQGMLIEQSALFWAILLVLIIACDIALKLCMKSCSAETQPKKHKFFTNLHGQLRYNIYIRYMIVAYMDLVFISGIVLFDSEEDVLSFRSIIALLILSFTVFLPWLVLFYLCAKFEKLQTKEMKSHFNTILLKVDKEDRWRIFLPCFYFFRRFATALILVLATTGSAPDYVQFSVIISLSAILLFYLAKEEPYQTRRMNSYVFFMEFLYFLLAMAVFAFTDATGEVGLKQGSAIFSIVLLCLFVVANFSVAFFFTHKGRLHLRESDLKHKADRRKEIERRANETSHRKDKRKRKKAKERNQIEMKRLLQLETKRDALRAQGNFTEEEIDAKLPLEPVQKTGLKFKAVMGSRLISYGIMSSSTDSNEEDQDYSAPDKGIEMVKVQDRQSMTRLPTHDEYNNDDNYDLRLETEAPLQAPKLHPRITAEFSGRSYGTDELGLNSKKDKQDQEQPGSYLQSSSHGDYADDELQQTERPLYTEADDDYLNTERPMFTEADGDEDDQLDVTGGRYRAHMQTPQQEDEYAHTQSFNAQVDPFTTLNNITAQSSQQAINQEEHQDQRILRLADLQ